MDQSVAIMGMPGVGFFGMLVIGFIAGYIAEKAMNRDHGLLTNILVGIAGSFVGGTFWQACWTSISTDFLEI